jgi:hypothetical protein
MRKTLLIIVLSSALLLSGFQAINELKNSRAIPKHEFEYHGQKGYTYYGERKDGTRQYNCPIILENGDIIRQGTITTDSGEKISVYMP